jgi:hypothetical protein
LVWVYLADPNGAALPSALPGQFLTLRLIVDGTAPPLQRSYSLSRAPGADTYRISVKREPHGAGSRFVCSRVHAGDVLEVAAPRGTFSDGEYPTNLPRLMGAMAEERDWPTALSTVNSHRSNGTLSVRPADGTENLCPHTVRAGPGLLLRQYVGGRGSRGRAAAWRHVPVR